MRNAANNFAMNAILLGSKHEGGKSGGTDVGISGNKVEVKTVMTNMKLGITESGWG